MITVNLGRRELGKSTLARYLACAKTQRVLIDPRMQWSDVDDARICATVTEVDVGLDGKITDLIYQPDTDDLDAAVADLAGMLKSRMGLKESLAVVLDEAGLYDVKSFDMVFRCHSRRDWSLILTAHRPADIPTRVRAIADRWALFRCVQQHDLDVIETRCGAHVARRVESLDPYQFILWDDALATAVEYLDGRQWKMPRDQTPLLGAPVKGTAKRRTLWGDL